MPLWPWALNTKSAPVVGSVDNHFYNRSFVNNVFRIAAPDRLASESHALQICVSSSAQSTSILGTIILIIPVLLPGENQITLGEQATTQLPIHFSKRLDCWHHQPERLHKTSCALICAALRRGAKSDMQASIAHSSLTTNCFLEVTYARTR